MDLITKSSKSLTPMKDPHGVQSKTQEISKISENSNPNVSYSIPGSKPTSSSPLTKSAKAQKSASKNPIAAQNVVLYSPRNKIRERKFVVAKKKNSKNEKLNSDSNPAVDCKCKARFGGNMQKCLCVAYETLRASQEEFFKNRDCIEDKDKSLGKEKGMDDLKRAECDVEEEEEEEEKEIEKGFMAQKNESDCVYNTDNQSLSESGQSGQLGVSTIKRRRDRFLEAARNSMPEPGSGAVMHLVEAFERLKTLPKEADKKEEEDIKESKKKAMQWALPGLQHPNVPELHPPEVLERQDSPSSLCPSDLFLTSENLGLDSRLSVSSSWDSSQGSISSRTSNGGRRSRRNSAESCGKMGGRRWKKKQMKITCQKPFKLRTEQRGRLKEEEFTKRLQEMMNEEEKQRIPIAQGLPWTTDEPENLIKPPVKESTKTLDLKLHSDVRAVERAEFDHKVAEKMSLFEQYKMERERQQKLAEEEEIRRLRKELVPKAQLMPYFDRPFIPRRSTKLPTIPKEPKFHIPQHKKIKSCLSWNDMSTFTYQEE
ncbi:conserved hypothetical protein [Ricinus communis]|uniref:TPX2 C-terminal domain-containing protein n=1 Tax=Ricinus communis TaxID=3988 RepID=B9SJC3_RICCO|nr:conserved hypothetical protein [Ricinus communis]|eukprot:XP_002526092.1 uncharacterized protein LOC8285046 [Ricinus communis]